MSYLLDTNAVIAQLKNEPPILRKRLRCAVTKGATVAVSSIVLWELWYGVARSANLRPPVGQPIPDFNDENGTMYPRESWEMLNAW